MKYFKTFLQVGGLVLLMALLSSCGEKRDQAGETNIDSSAAITKNSGKAELPMQYQRPAYMIGEELQVDPESVEEDDIALKVGATIRSTTGPQPLWDIMKRLAAMKNMNVSWESDVDKNVMVDVDINANDDFYKAVDNLLRQVDYFHEMQDNTIVVKYKETRQYHVGMPYTKQLFETGTGGNVLGGNDKAGSIEGTIRLDSKGNEYNIWENIQENLDKILNVWRTEEVTVSDEDVDTATDQQNGKGSDSKKSDELAQGKPVKKEPVRAAGTARQSKDENYYTIDKNIGMVSVTAPRPLLEKVDNYFATLKKHLYQQITIEAKIIEVQLTESSSLGINWSEVLQNFSLSGVIEFGSNGQIWPYIYSGDSGITTNDDGSYQKTYDPGRFVSSVTLNSASFEVFLNALKGQGQTKILSNPKLSVMNGQPALLSVGRNVTYIDSIEVEVDDDTGDKTYSVETDDILSGVGMALTATIVNDNEVIMNLVPVTSELENGVVDTTTIGDDAVTVGLPIVNIREMSTTVKVKDGEMLVIGGLISDSNEEEGEFLPILGDIPIVKYLFGHEEKTHTKRELIILLKPVLL